MTNILQIFVKLGDREGQIIFDHGSYVRTLSIGPVKTLGLPTIQPPKPYKVSWLDSTSLPIKLKCQVLIQL